MQIFNFYHQVSKNTHKNSIPLGDPYNVLKEWSTIQIKEYPRFEKVFLPDPKEVENKIFPILNSRRSCREFNASIDSKKLSSILHSSLGSMNETGSSEKRRYPSGGPLYPVEFYLFVFTNIDEIVSGVYHYGVEDNSLTKIKNLVFDKKIMDSLVIHDFAKKASCAVIMTSVFERSFIKYGEKAYRLILLEAGGAAQNLCLCATALGVGSIPMGGLIDDAAEELLDIDGSNESVVHSVFLG